MCTFVTSRLQKPRGARVRITANTLAMEGTFIMKARRTIVSTLVTLALGCCVVGLGACASGGTPSNGRQWRRRSSPHGGGHEGSDGHRHGPPHAGARRPADDGKKPAYEFTVAATADELVPRVAAGEFDIACVPANLAAKLYKQTNGGIRVIGINTLGVLYGISYDGGIQNLDGLAGRTVYLTGKGSVPGYTVEYLLDKARAFRSRHARIRLRALRGTRPPQRRPHGRRHRTRALRDRLACQGHRACPACST